MQILNIINDLLQTGSNRKSTIIGTLAEKNVKVANSVLVSVTEVTVTHCQFVEVTEHRQIQLFIYSHTAHLVKFDKTIICQQVQNSNPFVDTYQKFGYIVFIRNKARRSENGRLWCNDP